MSDILFIDIETCHATKPEIRERVKLAVRHPKAIKLQKSIDAWEIEKRPQAEDEAISKTSFSGLSGEIVCISFAVNDGEVKNVSRGVSESEKDMLNEFFSSFLQYGQRFNPTWCGHNATEFDLRFLFHRCVINGVKPSLIIPYNAKPWNNDVFDTLYETMGNNKTGGSLDAIAFAFGLEGKTKGIDGSKVNDFWVAGRINEIVTYCDQDIEITRGIFKKLKFIKSVSEMK